MKVQCRITKTHPVILHAPGGGPTEPLKGSHPKHQTQHPTWQTLLKHWQKSPAPEPGPDLSRELTVITWNTSQNKSILELSLEKLGVPCKVLGRGHRNWSNSLKLEIAIKFLTTVNTPYVLALDAYDVLVIDHPVKALEHFRQSSATLRAKMKPEQAAVISKVTA